MVKRRNKSNNNSNNKRSTPRSPQQPQPRSPNENVDDQNPSVGKPNGRPHTFDQKIADFIVNITREIGSKYQAALMANVPSTTFYRWLDCADDENRSDQAVFREFRQRLDDAEEEYRLPSTMDAKALTEQAKKEFARLMFRGSGETTVDVEERSGTSDKLGDYSEVVRKVRTTKKSVPPWVLQRQLGMYDGPETVKALIGYGMLKPEALDEVEVMFEEQITPSLRNIVDKYAIKATPCLTQAIEAMVIADKLRPEVTDFIKGKSKEEIAATFSDILRDFAVEKPDAPTE